MKKTSGYIVEYKNKDGTMQKAALIHSEQVSAFSDYKRAFLHLLTNDLTEKKDETGKKIISVNFLKDLNRIGFID
jgi:hypothetical protein